MTPLREWLRPPRGLLLLLFGFTVASVAALGWLGWKWIDQERFVEAQRAHERLEQSADRAAGALSGALAETANRLSAWASSPPATGKPEQGVLLISDESGLTAWPRGRVLYYPAESVSQESEAAGPAFSEGEALEFQAGPGSLEQVADWYRWRFGSAGDGATRAGALLRLARVLRKLGRNGEAETAYEQLAAERVSVAGVPAALIARHAIAELSGKRETAAALRADLLLGRWRLSCGQFEFYFGETSRLAGVADTVPPEQARWSELAAQVWEKLPREESARGQRTLWIGDRAAFLVWRKAAGRLAALITTPEEMMKPVLAGLGVAGAVSDSDGRLLAGARPASGRAAVRTAAETGLPWTLYIGSTGPSVEQSIAGQKRLLLLAAAVMALFLIGGGAFIVRAVRRDLEVSRIQSDFVSAVSHEFRSPLTSIRQLSELLAAGRVQSDDRRQIYYDTLVRETTRLQRLVEGLLNFGRMEAGARSYRFEEMETANLVERVVCEFELQIANSGRRIELEGAGERCTIDADPDALSVALRNLVDNALKYSPDCPTVWVGWGWNAERVAIHVRDRGAGIPESERRTIFEKFVRGSAAARANVKGSGVGLAMVRHIVAAHGGEITLASKPGEGSTFTILLPAGARA
jgi:signal transduction histidine kinase